MMLLLDSANQNKWMLGQHRSMHGTSLAILHVLLYQNTLNCWSGGLGMMMLSNIHHNGGTDVQFSSSVRSYQLTCGMLRKARYCTCNVDWDNLNCIDVLSNVLGWLTTIYKDTISKIRYWALKASVGWQIERKIQLVCYCASCKE